VLHFPASGRHVVLGHRAHQSVIDEFEKRHVPLVLGEVAVEMTASFAAVALAVMRQLEQPLIVAFNRGLLMLLPPAIA
jgi:hypothetical protein